MSGALGMTPEERLQRLRFERDLFMTAFIEAERKIDMLLSNRDFGFECEMGFRDLAARVLPYLQMLRPQQ